MSTTTTNYGLVKPELTDVADITATNPNWDLIDVKLKNIETITEIGGSGLTNHINDKTNPHKVTKSQVGLDKVDNTADADKPISTATQTALAGKQPKITGAASTVTDSNLTGGRVIISDTSGKLAISTVTSTELKYLSGVTSNIQNQLNSLPTASSLNTKVSKTGDTLTGSLSFQNKSDYEALGKYRTINGTDYYVDFGCGKVGGKGCVSLQYMEGSTVKGRLEVSGSGVSFYDKNGKRTYFYRNEVVTASVE